MPARITICYPDRPAVQTELFESGDYRLGRSRQCELILHHPTVSREHARMRYADNTWLLDDSRSQNGTKVNGVRVDSSALCGDELISVGELDCLFEAKTAQQMDAIRAHDSWRLNQTEQVCAHSLESTMQEQLLSVVNLTGTERGLILLGAEMNALQVAASQGISAQDFKADEFAGSVGAIEKALGSKAPVIAMDVSRDEFLAPRESIQRKQIAALAALPLISDDSLIGVLYTDSRQTGKLLTELDMEILSSLARQIALGAQARVLQSQVNTLQAWLNEAKEEREKCRPAL